MQKTPTYLGIFCTDPKQQSKQIREYCRQNIKQVDTVYKNESACSDYNQLESKFAFPKDNHHITVLFLGGNTNKLNQKQKQIMNSFQNDKKYIMKISLFVYVPGYIMVGYCPEISKQIEVENQYPHITLMLAQNAKAVESNDVLKKVLTENPLILKQEQKMMEMKGDYKGKKIYVLRREMQLNGISGDNFKYGRKK